MQFVSKNYANQIKNNPYCWKWQAITLMYLLETRWTTCIPFVPEYPLRSCMFSRDSGVQNAHNKCKFHIYSHQSYSDHSTGRNASLFSSKARVVSRRAFGPRLLEETRRIGSGKSCEQRFEIDGVPANEPFFSFRRWEKARQKETKNWNYPSHFVITVAIALQEWVFYKRRRLFAFNNNITVESLYRHVIWKYKAIWRDTSLRMCDLFTFASREKRA